MATAQGQASWQQRSLAEQRGWLPPRERAGAQGPRRVGLGAASADGDWPCHFPKSARGDPAGVSHPAGPDAGDVDIRTQGWSRGPLPEFSDAS